MNCKQFYIRGLNGRVGDEFKIDNRHINVTTIFSYLPKKHSPASRGKITKVFLFFYHDKF